MATSKRARKTTKSAATKSTATEPVAARAESTTVTVESVDIQEAIRTRAYELFEQRGFEHGHDCEDWLRAEAEVLARFGMRTA